MTTHSLTGHPHDSQDDLSVASDNDAESTTAQASATGGPSPMAANDRPGHVRVRRGNVHDAEELRRAFLQAAATLFADGGLEGVSMRAVAAAVGVSPMTPYRYFADKAELLTGLWDQAAVAVWARIREATAPVTGGRARLRALVDAFLGYWEEHPDQYRLVYMTERTTRREDRSTVQASPVYAEMLAFCLSTMREFAQELGASDAHVALADETRLLMSVGYLQSTLINRRYPFGDIAALRAMFLEQILAAVERVLVGGAANAADAAAAHASN